MRAVVAKATATTKKSKGDASSDQYKDRKSIEEGGNVTGRGLSAVLEFLRTLAQRSGADETDAELLHRFASRHEEDAYTALLQRHGPMVWGVCQRILHHPQNAEDAFQATFLVLARRAASVSKPHLLANWLYGVACRTALEARGRDEKRRKKQRPVVDVAVMEPTPEVVWTDLRPVLDMEINALPEMYRVPFVLCHLEGQTHEQAARLLGCPAGTVVSRLWGARQRLRGRLLRRGLSLPATLLASLLEQHASAMVPAALGATTARAAMATAGGAVVSAGVTILTERVLMAMALSRLKTVAVVFTILAVLVGTSLLPYWATTMGSPRAEAAAPPEAPLAKKPTLPEEVVRGENYLVFSARTDLHRLLLDGGRAGPSATKAIVVVDGMSVVRADGAVDGSALDFAGLGKALQPYRKSNDSILVNVCMGGGPNAGANVLGWALLGFAREDGCRNVATSFTWHGGPPYDWKERVDAAAKRLATGTNLDESAVGNDVVKVYPVRTMLSAWLTNESDCVVDILTPLIGSDEGIPPDIRDAIRRYTAELRLPQTGIMSIRVRAVGSQGDVVARFRAAGAEAFVQSLGFRNYNLTVQ
jgi:RNA polymerase sigma factor (sigma-70 family)